MRHSVCHILSVVHVDRATVHIVNVICELLTPVSLEWSVSAHKLHSSARPGVKPNVISVTFTNTETKMVIIRFTKTRTKTLEIDKTKII